MKRRFIVASKIYGQDAGMILETFQDAVDEIELPKGYNWDYKIDQLDNGQTAGQFFVMTDDDQPVFFITFSLVKDGEPIDILNDHKVYNTLVSKIQDYVKALGDLEQYVGKPEQKTIELSTSIEGTFIKASMQEEIDLENFISEKLDIISNLADSARRYWNYNNSMDDLVEMLEEMHELESAIVRWERL